MSSKNLLGKRKKKIKKCANPLFEQWLNEWRNEAAERGLKSQHIYARALNTLRKYPVVLTSGKECRILQNFGDKICQMLDEKLAAYVAVNGSVFPAHQISDSEDKTIHIPSPPKRAKTQVPTAVSDSPSGGKKRRNSSGNRPYMPLYRSGPYAIILTLYQKQQETGTMLMTKKDLMQAAQPLADKSFTIPDPGSRYTAWSSMGTLINKGFVSKFSCPAKYKLTEEGCSLAEGILVADSQIPKELTKDYSSQLSSVLALHTNSHPTYSGNSVHVVRNPTCSTSSADRSPPALPSLQSAFPNRPEPSTSSVNSRSMPQTSAPIYLCDSSENEEEDDVNVSLLERLKKRNNSSANSSPSLSAVASPCSASHGSLSASNNRATVSITTVTRALDTTSLTTSAFFSNDFNSRSTLSYCSAASLSKKSLSDTCSSSASQKRKPASFDFSSSEDEDIPVICIGSTQEKPMLSDFLSALPSVDRGMDSKEEGLKFWYVADGDRYSQDRDEALVTVDENIGVGFLVRVDYQQLLMSGKKYVLDTKRAFIDNDVFAYLANNDAPLWANPPKTATTQYAEQTKATSIRTEIMGTSSHSPSPSKSSTYTMASDLQQWSPVKNSMESQASSSTLSTPCKTKRFYVSKNSNSTDDLLPSLPKPSLPKPSFPKPSLPKPSLPKPDIVRPAPAFSRSNYQRPVILSPSSASLKSLTESSQSQESVLGSQGSMATPQIRLHPGTFQIMLLVDNNEIFGSGKGKEQLLQELQKNMVPLEVRKLQVGDFFWAARSKLNPLDELVFPEIVERKRMDDLASSITDGRFKEQKFRLRHCGLKKPIYLVEDYGSMKHFCINEDTLNQAIVNTQVIDQFFVKRTADVKESAAYLTIMTRLLQSKYLSKTLFSMGKKELDKLSAKEAVTNSEARLLTFDEFDRLSVKTRALTVQEMFGKQLVQIRGITPEKAAVIVSQYPTPACLIEAYMNCKTQKEKESLLANLKVGSLQRNIGGLISKTVCLLYTSDTFS